MELSPHSRQSDRRQLSHKPSSTLSLHSTRPTVAFRAAQHDDHPLARTKLYCLVWYI